MSRSFIKEEKKLEIAEETLEDIINKRLTDFQEFSSNWIEKVIAKEGELKDSSENNEFIQDKTLKR